MVTGTTVLALRLNFTVAKTVNIVHFRYTLARIQTLKTLQAWLVLKSETNMSRIPRIFTIFDQKYNALLALAPFSIASTVGLPERNLIPMSRIRPILGIFALHSTDLG